MISARGYGLRCLHGSDAVFGGQIGTLADTLSGLAGQMEALSAGVNTLVTEYETIDSGITAYTDAAAKIVAGYAQISGGAAQLVTGSNSLKTGTETPCAAGPGNSWRELRPSMTAPEPCGLRLPAWTRRSTKRLTN